MKEVKVVGQYEIGSLQQAERCLKDSEHFLLMADNHKGYGMPVGGVAVYNEKVSPAGVGFDRSFIDDIEEYINKVRKEDLKNIKSELERKSAEYRGLDKAGQALAEGFMMGRNACIDSVDKYIKLIRRNK